MKKYIFYINIYISYKIYIYFFFSILVTCDFMSNHIFDKMSSHTLIYPNQQFTINSEFNLYILQNNMVRYNF